MLSPHIATALNNIKAAQQTEQQDEVGPAISVNKLAGKAGSFYEKVRYMLDYKEEHVVRRSAIQRIIKRMRTFGVDDVGMRMITELIHGGYLPNDSVPEQEAGRIQHIVNTYRLLEHRIRDTHTDTNGLSGTIDLLTASAIDEHLFSQVVDNTIVEAFFNTIAHHVTLDVDEFPEAELHTQIYIACRRSLLEEDHESLFYALWKRYEADWIANPTPEETARAATGFFSLNATIEEQLRHRLGPRLVARLRNHAVYYMVIRELITRYGALSEDVLLNTEQIDLSIGEILEEKYTQNYEKVKRSGIRAILYILITKILLALVIEAPFEYYYLGGLDYIPLATNAFFHPLLLFVMVRGVKKPDSKNTNRVREGVHTILYDEHVIDPIYVKTKNTHPVLSVFLSLLYVALIAGIFGLILWLLLMLHFNIVSIILFLFFLTLVSYFGLRVRYNGRRWLVHTKEKGTLALLWSVMTLPIVRVGRWLSQTFQSINIFVFFMDFILEAPFKILLSVFDAFISFLREKEEETF